MVKTILVLGAGLAAVPFIHQTMRKTVLPSSEYKLVVVAPNTHFHYPIAIPRAVVPGQIKNEQVTYDLIPGFKKYPADKFEHFLGAAETLTTSSKTVVIRLNDGTSREISYDALVIATGSSTRDDSPWKITGTTENTIANLNRIREEIKNAKTIVVAGGGITGTETAGELGFEYSKSGKKEVIFIHSDKLPLAAPIKDSVRQAAKTELEKLKVKIISNSKVSKVTKNGEDTIVEITKADGKTESITAQAYLPALGLKPNTDFADASILDGSQRIKTTQTLQVQGHPEIFVIGDAGNSQLGLAQSADAQCKHVLEALPVYLKGGQPSAYVPKDPAYGITLGRSRATGQIAGFKVFSFMIYMFKGKTMTVEAVPAWAEGKKTGMTTYEK